MKNGILLAIAIAVLTMLAIGSPATVSAQFNLVEGPLGQSPFGTPPADAVGWFVINDEIGVVGIGHRDAAFGIPGRANPFNLQLVNPYEPHLANGASADADWGQGPTCKQNNVEVWHLHTNRAGFDPLPEGTFPSEFGLNPHVDPARGFCGHGKLGWLFAEIGFADEDDDGVGDADDLCPGTAAAATVDANGCAPDQLGTVVIKKVTVPPDLAGTFSFTHDINGGGTFDLSHGEEITFNNVPARPEVYTVTETVATGFTFGVWECRRPDGSLNTAGGQGDAFIIVNDDETITCTIPNLVDSDNDGADGDCDDADPNIFPGAVDIPGDGIDQDCDGVGADSDDLCSGTTLNDPVDGVGCSDSQVDNDGDGICDPGAPSAGPSGCTGTDQCPDTPSTETPDANGCSPSQLAGTGKVVIEKVTDPLGSADLFEFTDDIRGPAGFFDLSDGEALLFSAVPPGTYHVTETPAAGFVFGGWECRDPQGALIFDGLDPAATFDVFSGETTTCTFTNLEDSDNDGVPGFGDLCPGTGTGAGVDINGCSDQQVDGDGDGVCDPGAPSAGPSGCTGSAPPLDGDFDGDGDVDQDDLNIVVACFGQTAPLAPPCDAADVAPPPNGDGVINILDISFVGSNFSP